MPKRHALLPVFLLLLLSLAGCAKNVVPLLYTPTSQEVIPIAGSPTVCVVNLADGRSESAIGIRSDGSAFTPDSTVNEWISQALASELTRLGYVVTTAASEAAAHASGTHYIVSGTVEEVWLTETSSTSYECKMRIAVLLKQNNLVVMKNTFNSSLSRRVVPLISGEPKDILAETLKDLVHPIALAIQGKITP